MNAREKADLITVSEAAVVLAVSRQRVQQWIEDGRLEVVRIDESFPGGRRLLDTKAVQAFARQRTGR